MKWFRPAPGPVLFSYPALSLRGYFSSVTSRTRKIVEHCVIVLVLLCFCTLASFHRLLPFNFWDWIATMAKDAVVIGLAYCILLSIGRWLANRYPNTPQHEFSADSAWIHMDTVKGRRRRVYPDRVREWKEKEVTYEGTVFHFFTITFKDTVRGWLPDLTVVEFGIPKTEDLTRFRSWIDRHSLIVRRES